LKNKKPKEYQAVIDLFKQGWKKADIAKNQNLHRHTVTNYIKFYEAENKI
jgi:DNA invertase Pin-like site-specific DNA recombinase